MKRIRVRGNKTNADGSPREEILEVWLRDPAEVARELLGNALFRGKVCYAFQPSFEGGHRAYNEMWTADWWKEVEVSEAMIR
jgi:hypothetical protein